MKIQCDVCDKEEASVFCSADEAALCDACDGRIHHANKLASKHHRFSLLHNPASSKDSPRCDICQERRAFLFCQEDRAILCRECDLPIHTTNEHTQKHNRFLLTGVKLLSSPSLYPTSSSTSTHCYDVAVNTQIKTSQALTNKPISVSTQINSHSTDQTTLSSTTCGVHAQQTSQAGSVSTSSISEYLMETLPGWRVDDFLDSSSTSHGFCKTNDHLLPFMDQDFESNVSYFSSEDLAIWVPQPSQYLPQTGVVNKKSEEANAMNKVGKKWSTEDGFTYSSSYKPSISQEIKTFLVEI